MSFVCFVVPLASLFEKALFPHGNRHPFARRECLHVPQALAADAGELEAGDADLPDQDGDFSPYPTQTVDAIASGCQHAQAGTIERLYAMEQRGTPDVVCVLSGGAAGAVAPRRSPATCAERMM